ncbi:MAG: nucleotide pyrophosphohydrolase [Candidatus Heimdallarchaeota archaeon]
MPSQAISLDNLRKHIVAFIAERNWDQFHSYKNLAISIMLEAAELLELFQWADYTPSDLKNKPKLMQKICEELADIVIYVISFANKLEIDLGAQIVAKLKENEEKYPIPESIGRANKYHEYLTRKQTSHKKQGEER